MFVLEVAFFASVMPSDFQHSILICVGPNGDAVKQDLWEPSAKRIEVERLKCSIAQDDNVSGSVKAGRLFQRWSQASRGLVCQLLDPLQCIFFVGFLQPKRGSRVGCSRRVCGCSTRWSWSLLSEKGSDALLPVEGGHCEHCRTSAQVLTRAETRICLLGINFLSSRGVLSFGEVAFLASHDSMRDRSYLIQV